MVDNLSNDISLPLVSRSSLANVLWLKNMIFGRITLFLRLFWRDRLTELLTGSPYPRALSWSILSNVEIDFCRRDFCFEAVPLCYAFLDYNTASISASEPCRNWLMLTGFETCPALLCRTKSCMFECTCGWANLFGMASRKSLLWEVAIGPLPASLLLSIDGSSLNWRSSID